MKSTKILFLFFLFFFFVKKFQLRAQEPLQDSIAYYSELARKLKNDQDYTKSYNYFEKQRNFYKSKGNVLGEVSILISMAQIQIRTGFLFESQDSAVEALKLLDSLKPNENQNAYRESIYNHLGVLYYEIQDYKKSIEYYEKVIDLTSNPQSRITALNNLGNAYKELNSLEIALEYYKEAYDSSLKYNDLKATARALDNLGHAKSQMLIPGALQDLLNALKIREDVSFSSGIITSYIHLGEYYKDRNDRNKALFYANKALEISDSTNNIQFRKGALAFFNSLSTNERALEFNKLRDSLSKAEKLQKNRNAAQRYNLDLVKEEINEKELQLEQQKLSKYIFIFVAILIFSISVFLYFILKSRHKKEKLQQVFNTESRISKKVHDEVANDVFQVMTKLQSAKSDDALIDDIEQIYIKTRDISKEHSVIDLEGNFEDVINDLILSYNDVHTNVIAKGIAEVNWQTITEIKRITIYKVLQELLINMKKHSEASIVVLTFKTNNKSVLIKYSDNGKGCDLKKGSGLQNVENRIASLNGTITFDSEISKGFKVKLKV